jgi:hypothetical protein
MQPHSAQGLLAAWELGSAEPHIVDRALALLRAIRPEGPRAALAELSIGERDNLLLELRERVFGSRVSSVTVCPGCGERLELEFDVTDIRAEQPDHTIGTLSLRLEGHEVTFRLPNSLDIAALPAQGALDPKRRALLKRIVSSAAHLGRPVAAEELPEAVVAGIEARLSQADPQAEIQMNLACAACGHRWETGFDIASFLWAEVDAWAARILREVHSLALAYGWREADILAMNPGRRQRYLEMLNG